MRYRSTVSLCLLVLGLGLPLTPAMGQSVLPHTVELREEDLQQTGVRLLREAFQLSQFNQVPLALARAELAVQLIPEEADAWSLLGGLYLNAEKLDQGIRALETSRRLNAKNAGVHFSLGSAYFRKEQYARAEQILLAGLKIKPDTADARFDLGNVYYKQLEYDQAIAQYQQAFKLDEKLWPAINNIGLVQYEAGQRDQAMESWRAALKLDETASEPKLALGVALFTLGDKTEGIRLAQEALVQDSRYAEIDFLIENLWGERLIADTKPLLNTPSVRASLSSVSAPLPEENE